jgi:hypothetical protein
MTEKTECFELFMYIAYTRAHITYFILFLAQNRLSQGSGDRGSIFYYSYLKV